MNPAMAGPIMEGTTQAAENAANTRGCISGGYALATSTYSATCVNPVPSPCTNRPRDEQLHRRREPGQQQPPPRTSPTPAPMGRSGPRTSLHRPPSTVAITLAARVALKARLYRDMPSSSRATTGMAVATAMASKACNVTSATSPMLSARYWRREHARRVPTGLSTVVVIPANYGEGPGRHIGRRA
ncbi:hypothetical protein GCM10020220_062380 [Nonomuraea rubra]